MSIWGGSCSGFTKSYIYSRTGPVGSMISFSHKLMVSFNTFCCNTTRECATQRHIIRDMRPGTTACPACWELGTIEVKYCAVTVSTVSRTTPLECNATLYD